METDLPINETTPIANVLLADSDTQKAMSTILQVAASLLLNRMSEDISEWNLPKSTSLKTQRKILDEVDKWNELDRKRAIQLRSAWDVLRNYR